MGQLDLTDHGLAISRLAHHLEPGKRAEQRAQPRQDDRVVVGEDDPDD